MTVFDYDFNKTDDSVDVKVTDLESFFSVIKDNKDNYVYNLNETTYFNINDEDLETFVCNHDMYWPLISYKIYGTTRLAWILMKLNVVNANNFMDIIPTGTSIKYIDVDTLQQLITELQT